MLATVSCQAVQGINERGDSSCVATAAVGSKLWRIHLVGPVTRPAQYFYYEIAGVHVRGCGVGRIEVCDTRGIEKHHDPVPIYWCRRPRNSGSPSKNPELVTRSAQDRPEATNFANDLGS